MALGDQTQTVLLVFAVRSFVERPSDLQLRVHYDGQCYQALVDLDMTVRIQAKRVRFARAVAPTQRGHSLAR